MIFLVALMLLGAAAMISSNVHYKLAGNYQYLDLALNNAEAADAEAANWLQGNRNSAAFTNYNSTSQPYIHPIGHFEGLASPNNDPLQMIWDPSSNGNSNAVNGSSDKQYMIQMKSQNVRLLNTNVNTGGRASSGCNIVNTYLITTRGTSAGGAVRFLESYYSLLNC
jgi:Tfp pilus assembly protein PilX